MHFEKHYSNEHTEPDSDRNVLPKRLKNKRRRGSRERERKQNYIVSFLKSLHCLAISQSMHDTTAQLNFKAININTPRNFSKHISSPYTKNLLILSPPHPGESRGWSGFLESNTLKTPRPLCIHLFHQTWDSHTHTHTVLYAVCRIILYSRPYLLLFRHLTWPTTACLKIQPRALKLRPWKQWRRWWR